MRERKASDRKFFSRVKSQKSRRGISLPKTFSVSHHNYQRTPPEPLEVPAAVYPPSLKRFLGAAKRSACASSKISFTRPLKR